MSCPDESGGVPLSDMAILNNKTGQGYAMGSACEHVNSKQSKTMSRTVDTVDVIFVRHRILYARPNLTTRGKIRCGFSHMRERNL